MNNLLKEKTEIIDWLDHYGVENYTLQLDKKYGYVVGVNGNVNLVNKRLDSIAVKFGKVAAFFCQANNLTSLLGCPERVEGTFDCSYNYLKNLEHCPAYVEKHFICQSNEIATLEFCPKHVGNNVFCADANSALGDLQNVSDFKKFYEIHQEFENIKQEKEKLSKSVMASIGSRTTLKI